MKYTAIILIALATGALAQTNNIFRGLNIRRPEVRRPEIIRPDIQVRPEIRRITVQPAPTFYRRTSGDGSGAYVGDDSGAYRPDASGRYSDNSGQYVHQDNPYRHQDFAGGQYQHQDVGGGNYKHQDVGGGDYQHQGGAGGQYKPQIVAGGAVERPIGRPSGTIKSGLGPCAVDTKNARIIQDDGTVDPDSYKYVYETENCIFAEEQGQLVNPGAKDEIMRAQGNFHYPSPDGTFIEVHYTADENGFQPSGAHLPTPPPIPLLIAKALEYKRSIGELK